MLGQIKEIKENILADIKKSTNLEEIEERRIKYLSRKGEIPKLFSKMKEIEPSQRKELGLLLNSLKEEALSLINSMRASLETTGSGTEIDLSLPPRKIDLGREHPWQRTRNELASIFKRMGFSIATGPEVETEYYIFDALNMPSWHPARRVSDSLYVDEKRLLRTETSSVQIRTMEKKKPPLRIISPGRVYRNEKENATHMAMFSQCEGLYVDKGVSFAGLKGTLLAFFRTLYGKDTKVRFRPHYFPFTEPSAEADVTCFSCNGKKSDCPICKGTGWIEIGGCGMVNPVVLEGVGIDSEVYTGYAFGLGIERMAMLKYGISDIRMIYENDLRFLEQF